MITGSSCERTLDLNFSPLPWATLVLIKKSRVNWIGWNFLKLPDRFEMNIKGDSSRTNSGIPLGSFFMGNTFWKKLNKQFYKRLNDTLTPWRVYLVTRCRSYDALVKRFRYCNWRFNIWNWISFYKLEKYKVKYNIKIFEYTCVSFFLFYLRQSSPLVSFCYRKNFTFIRSIILSFRILYYPESKTLKFDSVIPCPLGNSLSEGNTLCVYLFSFPLSIRSFLILLFRVRNEIIRIIK